MEVNLINKEEWSEENNHCFGLRTGCAFGVCTNQHDYDQRNNNVDKTVDHNDYEHNLRGGYCKYI